MIHLPKTLVSSPQLLHPKLVVGIKSMSPLRNCGGRDLDASAVGGICSQELKKLEVGRIGPMSGGAGVGGHLRNDK